MSSQKITEKTDKIMTPQEERELSKSTRVKENIINQDLEAMKKVATSSPTMLAMIILVEVQRIEWLLINLLQELACCPYDKCLGYIKKIKSPKNLSINKIESLLRNQQVQVGRTLNNREFQKMTIEDLISKITPWMETITLSQKEYYEMTLGELKNELQLFTCSPLQLLSNKVGNLNEVRINLVHKLFFPGKLSTLISDIRDGNKAINEIYTQLVEVENFLKKNFSFRIFMDNLPVIKKTGQLTE